MSMLMRRAFMGGMTLGPVAYGSTAGASWSSGVASSVVITKPSTTASGNLMLLCANGAAGIAFSALSGWTQVVSASATLVYYKVATGSEPANYTLSFTGSTGGHAVIAVFSGAAYDTISTIATGASGTTATASTVTESQSASYVVTFIGTSTPFAGTPSTPTSMTSIVASSDSNVSWGLFYQSVGAGATGSRASTINSADWSALNIAVKPG